MPKIDTRIITDTRLTMHFLLMISSHLSTRSDCKDVNYHVTITEDTISFEPDVKVFPDTHNRKPTDKMSILEHILRYHMNSLVPQDKEENNALQAVSW